MSSRRSFLRATAAAGLGGGLAGCPGIPPARTGELQLKAVSVAWTHDGRRYRDQVLFVALDEAGVVDGRVDEDLARFAEAPTDLVVPEVAHDRLEARFEAVEYALGVCGRAFGAADERGCRNTRARRRDFNRVHFGDRATVRLVDTEDGDAFRVVEVRDGPRRDWRSEVTTFDFDAIHADHGL